MPHTFDPHHPSQKFSPPKDFVSRAPQRKAPRRLPNPVILCALGIMMVVGDVHVATSTLTALAATAVTRANAAAGTSPNQPAKADGNFRTDETGTAARRPVVLLSNTQLPGPVAEMRDAILEAVAVGDIAELRLALEWNELRPDLGIARDADPIGHFRSISTDGEGLEVLAILANLLSAPPTRLKIGPDLENNHVFVWPGLSEADLKALTARQRIDLFRIVPAKEAQESLKSGRWHWYRVAIGADGTWHVFKKAP